MTPAKGSEDGVKFDTLMLIYMHWAIMAHSEKLLDITAWGNVKLPSQKGNVAFALLSSYIEKETPLVGQFLPKGQYSNKLVRGLLGDATYKISRLYA